MKEQCHRFVRERDKTKALIEGLGRSVLGIYDYKSATYLGRQGGTREKSMHQEAFAKPQVPEVYVNRHPAY